MFGVQLISGFRVGKFSDPKMYKVFCDSELCGVERVVIQAGVVMQASIVRAKTLL
jgi:hypothetical protein